MSHNYASIYDGTSNTFLLAENINAGVMLTWSNPAPQNCTFMYPVVANAVDASSFPDPPVPVGLSGSA